MEADKIDEEHIKKCSDNFAKVTFRPLEVAGAAASDSIPSDFETAKQQGQEIKGLLSA